MASYKVWTVTFKQSVAKDLRAIPNAEVRRILDRIDTLAVNPRGDGCVKLSGQERYRVRQGAYRIVYEIHDDRLLVIVIKAGHRSGVYEKR
ncbi:MAG: type II toxin-antitoxin system RelE/ParE family toxin [Burkholderiales bacterium]|nr:type II toxin-antitoxin system RelE/ParE family toxin [Burkholderiales bacterium]MCW5604673.1 type II toxin-antitoxin system RelE/ParE family toxin [Burkholderiales bacterium]